MFVFNRMIQPEECEPGVTRKILTYSKELMMVEVYFKEGAIGKEHQHPHLQITYVAEGEFEFRVGDQKRTVCKGDSVYIDTNVIHGVKALKPGKLVDVFNPMRQDFL